MLLNFFFRKRILKDFLISVNHQKKDGSESSKLYVSQVWRTETIKRGVVFDRQLA